MQIKSPEGAAGEYLLVDGYSVIFAWDDLNELAKYNIGSAEEGSGHPVKLSGI